MQERSLSYQIFHFDTRKAIWFKKVPLETIKVFYCQKVHSNTRKVILPEMSLLYQKVYFDIRKINLLPERSYSAGKVILIPERSFSIKQVTHMPKRSLGNRQASVVQERLF